MGQGAGDGDGDDDDVGDDGNDGDINWLLMGNILVMEAGESLISDIMGNGGGFKLIMNTIRFTLIHLYISHYFIAQYIISLVQQYGDLHLNIFIYIIHVVIYGRRVISHLNVSSAHSSDGGLYRCQAENAVRLFCPS